MKLPLYNPDARCVKCGGENVTSYFRAKGTTLFGGSRERHASFECPVDLIERRCERCRFEWDERPMDKATPLEIASRAGKEKAS